MTLTREDAEDVVREAFSIQQERNVNGQAGRRAGSISLANRKESPNLQHLPPWRSSSRGRRSLLSLAASFLAGEHANLTTPSQTSAAIRPENGRISTRKSKC